MKFPGLNIFRKKKKEFQPGITLVIPVFNRISRIEDTLQSVMAQTRMPERIILVDNNSKDGSWEYLLKWKEDMESSRDVKVSVKREPRPGAARARKTGLQFVETEYVMFFDSDDTMEKDHIEKIMADFEGDPSLDMGIWQTTEVFSANNKRKSRLWADGSHRQLIDNHLIQSMLTTGCYAVRTSFIRDVGDWDPEIMVWDDYELGLRLLLNNPKVKLNQESRMNHIRHENSISGEGYSHKAGEWEKTLARMEQVARESDDELREHILRMLDYRRVNLAAHYRHEGYKDLSRELKEEALQGEFLTDKDVRVLKLAYKYTSTGMRGAGAIFAPRIS